MLHDRGARRPARAPQAVAAATAAPRRDRDPGYRDAADWANLGWVYRSMNEPRESIEAYRKALALDPIKG